MGGIWFDASVSIKMHGNGSFGTMLLLVSPYNFLICCINFKYPVLTFVQLDLSLTEEAVTRGYELAKIGTHVLLM